SRSLSNLAFSDFSLANNHRPFSFIQTPSLSSLQDVDATVVVVRRVAVGPPHHPTSFSATTQI
ncbi:hypothetical protein A2U01_0109681, partial [Trifolium medium]|nr:hypothetical protein [Trifolium medium]